MLLGANTGWLRLGRLFRVGGHAKAKLTAHAGKLSSRWGANVRWEDLFAEYPELEPEDIRQALEFAARSLDDQVIELVG